MPHIYSTWVLKSFFGFCMQNVFITGGNAMFSHFKERLEHELLAMRPFQSTFSVSIASEFHICIILLKHTALLLLLKTASFTPTHILTNYPRTNTEWPKTNSKFEKVTLLQIWPLTHQWPNLFLTVLSDCKKSYLEKFRTFHV